MLAYPAKNSGETRARLRTQSGRSPNSRSRYDVVSVSVSTPSPCQSSVSSERKLRDVDRARTPCEMVAVSAISRTASGDARPCSSPAHRRCEHPPPDRAPRTCRTKTSARSISVSSAPACSSSKTRAYADAMLGSKSLRNSNSFKEPPPRYSPSLPATVDLFEDSGTESCPQAIHGSVKVKSDRLSLPRFRTGKNLVA